MGKLIIESIGEPNDDGWDDLVAASADQRLEGPEFTDEDRREQDEAIAKLKAPYSPGAWRRVIEIAEAHSCTVVLLTTRGGRSVLGAEVRNASGEAVHGNGYRATPPTIADHFQEAL